VWTRRSAKHAAKHHHLHTYSYLPTTPQNCLPPQTENTSRRSGILPTPAQDRTSETSPSPHPSLYLAKVRNQTARIRGALDIRSHPLKPRQLPVVSSVASMASDSFRSQINSLGWSRRVETAATTPSSPFLSKLSSLNPFGNSGYARLPVSNSDPAPPPADESFLACESVHVKLVFLARVSGFGSPRDEVGRLECRMGQMHMGIEAVKTYLLNIALVADW